MTGIMIALGDRVNQRAKLMRLRRSANPQPLGQVIEIRLSEDLETRSQNRLRYNIEMCRWLWRWRKAQDERDFEAMDYLDRDYERVGLP